MFKNEYTLSTHPVETPIEGNYIDPRIRAFEETFCMNFTDYLTDLLTLKGKLIGGATANKTKVKQVIKDTIPFLPGVMKSTIGQLLSTQEQSDTVNLALNLSILQREELKQASQVLASLLTNSFSLILAQLYDITDAKTLAMKMIKRIFRKFAHSETLLNSLVSLNKRAETAYFNDHSKHRITRYAEERRTIFLQHCIIALMQSHACTQEKIKTIHNTLLSADGICRKSGVEEGGKVYGKRQREETNISKYGIRYAIPKYDIYKNEDWIDYTNEFFNVGHDQRDSEAYRQRRALIEATLKEVMNTIRRYDKKSKSQSVIDFYRICENNFHTFNSPFQQFPYAKMLVIFRKNVLARLQHSIHKEYKRALKHFITHSESLIIKEVNDDIHSLLHTEKSRPDLLIKIRQNLNFLSDNHFELKPERAALLDKPVLETVNAIKEKKKYSFNALADFASRFFPLSTEEKTSYFSHSGQFMLLPPRLESETAKHSPMPLKPRHAY